MKKEVLHFSRTINWLFPIFDFLYIYQLLEYEPKDFVKWFLRNPFKRNLQKKNKLEMTLKAWLILIISVFLIWFVSQILSTGFWSALILVILFFQISPLFILIAQLLIYPLEEYQKRKILNAAKNKLRKYPNLKVVAIVGSFAKTSTKNMLHTLLWKDFRVVKTPKSYNTPISISRTVLSDIKDTTEIFLVEMDAYHKGEIKNLAKYFKPDLAIITGIAPQHLERFGSMEVLAKTQFEIASNVKTLFLNSGSKWILDLEKNYDVKKVFYGEGEEDDVSVKSISQNQSGIFFQLTVNDQQLTVNLPVFGTHNAINFAGAAAIASKLGLPLKTIEERAKLVLPTEHRLEIIKKGNLTIIDNTYNTNPIASKSSLKLLGDMKGSQKILITPGLVELGDEAFEQNRQFIIDASKVADEIIIVGENARKALVNGLSEINYPKDKRHLVKSTQDGLNLLSKMAKAGAVVLLENDLPDQYS